MINKLRSVPKDKYWEYFILVARFLLAVVFIGYGYSKLTEGQFGLQPEELSTPIKDLSLFRIMWYLFGHEPFKTVVGILQIITGILLLYNRTVILGVFFFIPIAANIVLMDISFMPESLGMAFARRFTFYFILCFCILWSEKERMKIIWNAMIKKASFKLKFPILLYLFIPLFALMLEFLTGIPYAIYYYVSNPGEIYKTFEMIKQIFH